MITDEKMDIYFEYRYLIDNVLQKYLPEKYDYEELYDAGIRGLMESIDEYGRQIELDNIDFKLFALFYIKREINKTIN